MRGADSDAPIPALNMSIMKLSNPIYLGWALLIISLPLPAMPSEFMGGSVTGSFCFIWSTCSITEISKNHDWGGAIIILAGFYNLFLLLSPVIYWRLRKGHCSWCRMLIAGVIAIPVSCFFYYEGWNGGLLVGYYVWLSASLLITIGLTKTRILRVDSISKDTEVTYAVDVRNI